MTVANCAPRLEALRRTGLLDTPREEAFDRLTRLASVFLQAPVALITLVDDDRQLFKSAVGLPEPMNTTRYTPRTHSFCQHVVASGEPLLISDTREHPLVCGNPAIQDLGAIAYAGIPLVTDDGHALGTLCVIDTVPRRWTEHEVSTLRDLAAVAMTEVTLRREVVERERAEHERNVLQQTLDVDRDRLGALFEQAPAFIAWVRGPDHVFEGANRAYRQLVGFRDIVGTSVADAVPETVTLGLVAALDGVLETGEPFVATGVRLLLQRTPDGTQEECFANFVYQPLVDADGTRWGVFCHGVDVTEQVRATMAVRESEAHHRRVLDSLPVLVYRAEAAPPYATIFVNAAVEVLGYTRAEWLARPDMWDSCLHPDDRTRMRQHALDSYTMAQPMDCQYRMVARDASVRWFHGRSELVPDGRGERRVWQGILLDVTAQREAEDASRESEALLRATQEIANVGSWSWDLHTGELRWSEELFRIFGLEPGSALVAYDAFVSRIHPDDRARIEARIADAVHAGGAFEFGHRVVRDDGVIRSVQCRGRLIVDDRGVPTRLIGSSQDVTERLRTEEVLLESEARHRLIFDEAGIGMAVCDLDGGVEQANAALCEFLGYQRDELVGMRYRDVLHADELASDRLETQELLTGAITRVTRERRYLRKDGSVVWGLLTVALLRDGDGAPARRITQVQDITDWKHAESALRESEARNRALVETAHEGIWTVDHLGTTTYVNSRLCDMLGHSAREMLGRPSFDFMAPETAFEARLLFARRQRGIAEVHDVALRRRDGSELFVLMSTSPLVGTDGELAGALLMATDITKRREAEQALRESEARYRHVVANAPGMVYQFTYRPDGAQGYTFVSEGARAIFGVDPEAVLRDPATLRDLVHPDDRAQFEEHGRAVVTAAGNSRWEGRIVLPSGEERFVQVVAHDQLAPDGTVLSDGLVVDVTEQRQAVRQLEQSEIRFRLVARATNDVVYDWNIPTGEHFWGETLLTAFGYDARLFRPTYEWWASLIHPDDAPRVTGNLAALLAGASEAWTEEYRFCRSDGIHARVLDRGYVQRDDAGQAIRLVGSMIDLTEHQLLEEQLRQAQKMEAVGRLAGGVAHDFNNLITVINVSTSFLLADMDAADARCDDVRQIAAAADRAAGLTRQLLAFSRKQILKPTVLGVNVVIANLRPMLARLLGEDVLVEMRLQDGIDSIMADVGQLEQVLMNLAVNARDAMPDGGRILVETSHITLDSRYAADHSAQGQAVVVPGEYVMIAVSDTGTGMSHDVQARIFEPFYTTKEAGKGTGLGLSTVYGIVKQSAGHIWVYSELGEGTVFKLYFPRIASAAAAPLGQAAADAPVHGSATILLVEDDDAVRRLARRILDGQGYRVLESRNGREALERVTQHDGPIHLVLTDVIMPEMSGRGLVQRLRAVRPNAAVVYISGYTEDDVLRRGLFEPGSRFVQKPFGPQELLRVVGEMLEKQG